MKHFFLFLCLCSTLGFALNAQQHSSSYFQFLKQDSMGQNHLLQVGISSHYSGFGKTLHTRGLIANFGVNLARLFTKKMVFGVCADYKIIPGIGQIRASNQFKTDFNDNLILKQAQPLDSANARVYSSNLNANPIGSIMGTIGLMISPFPQRYGGLMLQVKYGVSSYFFHNDVYGNAYVDSGAYDKVPMSVSGNWTYELIVKPFSFKRNTHYSKYDSEENFDQFCNAFTISLFYTRLNFKSASFNGTNLSHVVEAPFMERYGIDHQFGFKIGLNLY